jgi:hypothetical protein
MTGPRIRKALTFWCVALLLPATLAVAGSKKKTDPVADLRAAVANEVADPDRAARMTAAIDDLAAQIGQAGAFAARVSAELAPMLKDRAVSREAIEAKFAELNAERAVLAERTFSAHLALKAAATPAEWKKLRKVEERVLAEALGKSLQGEEPEGKEG